MIPEDLSEYRLGELYIFLYFILKVGLDDLMAGVDHLVSLSQPKWFYDFMIFVLICSLALSSSFKTMRQLLYKDMLLREGHRYALCGHHYLKERINKYLIQGHISSALGTLQFWGPESSSRLPQLPLISC